jgi:hypothetical protein
MSPTTPIRTDPSGHLWFVPFRPPGPRRAHRTGTPKLHELSRTPRCEGHPTDCLLTLSRRRPLEPSRSGGGRFLCRLSRSPSGW